MNNGIHSTNQLPNQLPHPLSNQSQNSLVTANSSNTAGQRTNGMHFIVNNGNANTSSTSSSVAAWLQNNPVGGSSSRTVSWHIPYPNPSGPHTMVNGTSSAHQSSNPISSTSIGNGAHSNYPPAPIPHPLHFHTYGIPSTSASSSSNGITGRPAPFPHPLHFHTYGIPSTSASSSSNGITGSQQYGIPSVSSSSNGITGSQQYGIPSVSSSSNVIMGSQQNNALGSLFPKGPTRTAPAINIVPSSKVNKRRAQSTPTDTSPKKPRGRPKKPRTVTFQLNPQNHPAAIAALATALSAARPARMAMPSAFATIPSTVGSSLSFGAGILFNSTPASFGMPSTSTTLATPPKYVPPLHSRPILTAAMPVPPNWLANMENSVMSLVTFNQYEIGEDTAEYQTISDMLYPIRVESVEQIVNPDLWDRFVKTRTDMMRSKTDDLNVLSKLGLSEKEVLRCAHLSLNFRKDPLLIPYSDNMVLLYHCTRSQTNVKNILSQGLDERLSSSSAGLLGKGIYFADDPNKSIQYDGTGYIFIFAVLLGDCISVDHFQNQRQFVREPEKVAQQKRNFNDQFFDSIVARPAGHNEYVIYNRYQCCPIYQVKYDRNTAAGGSQTFFQTSSVKLPPIAWLPSEQNYAMPIQDQTINWPFFAVDIFASMGVPPPTDEDVDNGLAQNTSQAENTSQASMDDNLATLINLGFNDPTKNREILVKFNNDLEQAVNYYLDNGSTTEEDATVNGPETTIEGSVNTSSSSSTLETEMLFNLGFCDLAKNQEVLAKFNNDVDLAVNYFLDNPNVDAPNAETPVKSNISGNAGASGTNQSTAISSIIANHCDESIVTIDLIDDDSDCAGDEKAIDVTSTILSGSADLPDDIAEWALDFSLKREQVEMVKQEQVEMEENEECPICYNEITSSSWQILECKHKLCAACYSKLLTSRSTMSGTRHTFVKCPFCHATCGTEVGTCPDMQMGISTQLIQCEGFTTVTTLVIEYVGQNFKRTAYLPNNDVGRDVLHLLKIAFDRRLCFTVGTSNTTGQENAIVWNIHHKTATHGGVASYGYPDPEYFDRVKAELKTFGIQ